MNIFCDCEFNTNTGALISLALVTEDGQRHFYEVIDLCEPIDPWVKENVMPILEKTPIPYNTFQERLQRFLKQFPVVVVYTDHVSDVIRLCAAMQTTMGEWLLKDTGVPVTFIVEDKLSAKESKVKHNAYYDAVAIRDSYLKLNGAI